MGTWVHITKNDRTSAKGYWTTPVRARCIALHFDGEISDRQIEKLTGVPRRTLRGWWQAPHARRLVGTKQLGRPRLLNDRNTRRILRVIRRNYDGRALS